MDDQIPLPLVAVEILKQTGVPVPGAYRRLYNAVIDGRLAAKMTNGRYSVGRGALPQAADVLGQTIPKKASAKAA